MKAPDFVEKGAGLLEIKIVVYLQGAKKEEKEMYFKRALSILLSCVLTFSTISFSAVSVYAEEGGDEAVGIVLEEEEEAAEEPEAAPAAAAAVEEGEPEEADDDAMSQGEEGDYFVILNCVDGHGVVCPGEEVFLEAKAWHWTPHEVIREGFLYKWEIVSIETTGAGNGTVSFKDGIEGQIGDYPTAALEFGGVPDMEACDHDESNFEYIVTVRVTVYDGTDEAGNPIERASDEISGIALKDEYFEITPHNFDQLRIGESAVVPFSFIYYSYYIADKYGQVSDLSWSFEYDDTVFEIFDPEGNLVDSTGENAVPASEDVTEFTIRRIAQGELNGRVTANFTYVDHNGTLHDIGEQYSEDVHYWPLNDEDYPISFEEYDVDFNSDAAEPGELVLNTEGLGEDWQEKLELAVTAGHWDHENEVYMDQLEDSAYTVNVIEEEGTVRIAYTNDYLEEVRALSRDDHVRFYVDVYQKGADHTEANRISRTDGWLRVHPTGSSQSEGSESHLWTGDLEPGLEVGQEQAVTCEVRAYPGADGAEYDVLDNAGYFWHYDDRAVRVYDENGQLVGNDNEDGTYRGSDASTGAARTFTIYRRRQWETDVFLDVRWTDQAGREQQENRVYHLEDREYSVRIDDMGDDRVYSDGNRAFPLQTEGLPDGAVYGTDYTIDTTVGLRNSDDFEETFTEGVDYTCDGQNLILCGDKIAARGLEDGQTFSADLMLSLKSTRAENGWENVWVEPRDFRFREARVDYEADRERDRSMLPGWDGMVKACYSCRIENSEHPDGEEVWYSVRDVEVVRDEPWEGEDGDVVTEFRRNQNEYNADDYSWYYRVGHCGEADLKVTYEDLDGREQSYVFTLHVGTDVYSVYMDSTGRERHAFPGGTIELFAEPEHEFMDENGDYHRIGEGMGYTWSFEYGSEYADIEVHADDPSRATLRFIDLPEDGDWEDCDVRVGVRVLDAEGNETGGYDATNFRLCREYAVVLPLLFDRNMELGDSIEDQQFETRWFRMGWDDYKPIDALYDVRYEWYYDENAFRITENRNGQTVEIHDGESGSGNTFTILRRGSWASGFSIRAVWTDEDGNRQEAQTNHQVLHRDYNIRFEEHDIDLFTDEVPPAELVLDTGDLGENWQDRFELSLTAGRWDDDHWKDILDESGYTVTKTDGTVRISLTEAYLDSVKDHDDLRFVAELYLRGAEHNDDNRLCDTDAWYHIREARTEYDFERDRDMLPGWDGSVGGSYNCRVENSEHPDGEDIPYRVLNVEVVRDEPWEGEDGNVVTDFHRDQDENDENNYWWYYRVEHCGEADLKVTYEDLDGEEQSYLFTLRVSGDVYQVSMDSVGDEQNALPGGSIELFAEANHLYFDEDGRQQSTSEGMGYRWFFEYGSEFADIEVHADDPSRATLRFKELPEGQDRIEEKVRVAVRVLDAEGNETGGYTSPFDFWVRDEFVVIWPLGLPRYPDVGAGFENQKFEVWRYVLGRDGHEVIDNVRYQWKNVDKNAVRITEMRNGAEVEVDNDETTSGDTFTITRRRGWRTEIVLRAVWDEDGGERDAWGHYWLEDKRYDDLFLNGEDDSINDDEEKTFALDPQAVGSFGGDVLLFVNYRAADRIEDLGDRLDGLTENIDYVIDEDGAVYINMTGEEYSFGEDGLSVIVNGDRVERILRSSVCTEDPERFRSEFYIGALLVYEGETISSNWCRVSLRRTGKSIQEISAKNVTMSLYDTPTATVTCPENGGELSFESSNSRVVKVDAATGKLTPVALGTATITVRAAATGDYRPGRTTFTAKVAALNLSKATITTNAPSAGYTYNGKAQKPSTVTVKYKGHTFVSGTDYTVKYPKDVTFAGTKTITVTAKSKKVSGSAEVTYKINKAAQKLAVKTGSTTAEAAAAVKTTKTVTISVGSKIVCAVTGSKGNISASSDKAYATTGSLDQTKKTFAVKGVKVGSIKLRITSAATDNFNKTVLEVTLNIVPAATSSLKAENLATGFKLTWAKVTGAAGYYVYRDSTKIATIKKNATVTYTDKAADTNGTKYVYKVVPYATLNNKAVASTAKPRTVTTYRLTRPAISSLTNSAAGKMTVKWAKNAKSTGYQVQYGLKSDFSDKKTVTISSAATVTSTIAKLTQNKTYYVRLRCVKKVGSTTYTSAWSAAKKIKITK